MLVRKIHQPQKKLVSIANQLRKAFSKNPPTAIHTQQLVGFWIEHFAVGGLLEQALCSWWVIGTSTLQLVGYWNKHFAVGGLLEQALCSWWVIGTSTLQLAEFPNKHSAVSRFFELALRSWWIFMRRGRTLFYVITKLNWLIFLHSPKLNFSPRGIL